MSDHNQFRGLRSSLQDLSFRHVCQQLDGTCRRLQTLSEQQSIPQVLALAKQTIRPYYMKIPSYLRSKIIETLGMQHNSLISKHTMLYLIALLLSHNIKHLKIIICCYYECRYQSSLLQLLASEGIGLESLDMTRSSLLDVNCKLFHSTLLNMKNLSSLTLRKIASDEMLKVIGKTCTKLVILDVAYSKQVTDEGLKQLLQVKTWKLPPVSSRQQTEAHKHWSLLQRVFSMLGVNWDFQFEWKKKPILFEYYKNRNSLCDTLKVLNITKTCTTYVSVWLTLINIPQLESLTDYDENIAEIIIFINVRKLADFKIPCALTEMRIRKPKFACLKILAQACPLMKKLHISEPVFRDIRIFPHITSLIIYDVPMKKEWINTYCNYLRTNGHNLHELHLRTILHSNVVPDVDMREILLNCPNLHILITHGVNMIWTEGHNPLPLRYLRKVQLGYQAFVSGIIKLLSLAPKLIILHLYRVPDLKNEHLKNLLKPPTKSGRNRILKECDGLQNLTCFYISQTNTISVTTVLNMLYNCRRLRRIGDLEKWGLDNEDINMLKKTFPDINISRECPDLFY